MSFNTTRAIASLIWAGSLTYATAEMYIRHAEIDPTRKQSSRYYVNLSGAMLPLYMITFLIIGIPLYGIGFNLWQFLSSFMVIFLEIGVYYIFLTPLIPWLRKFLNARTIALLWFVPNYLYVVTIYSGFEGTLPGFVINIPNNILPVVLAVWFAGFVAVLVWYTVQHLSFRRYLLDGAEEVTDRRILDIMNEIIKEADIQKPRFKLVVSDKTTTPMSIGLRRKAVRLVLPHTNYTDEELRLILKHEIIHIARDDGNSKFGMVFSCRMCWFNPFMWFAMKKCAEDLELSCDEAVLLNADDTTRRKYARLILSAAGDGRGFTTCLSATAKSLLYRLKSITKPVVRINGSYVVGMVFFVLAMFYGTVAFAYDEKTGREYIFTAGRHSEYTARNVAIENIGRADISAESREKIKEYLSSLKMSRVSCEYEPPTNSVNFSVSLYGPEDRKYVHLYDEGIYVQFLGRGSRSEYYHLPEGVDIEYLIEICEN